MKQNELQELHVVTRGRFVDGVGQYEMAVIARSKTNKPGKGKVVRKLDGLTEATTPQEAQMMAVIEAVRYLDSITEIQGVPLTIHTPSEMAAGVKASKAPHLAVLAEKISAIAGCINISRLPAKNVRQVLAMQGS